MFVCFGPESPKAQTSGQAFLLQHCADEIRFFSLTVLVQWTSSLNLSLIVTKSKVEHSNNSQEPLHGKCRDCKP